MYRSLVSLKASSTASGVRRKACSLRRVVRSSTFAVVMSFSTTRFTDFARVIVVSMRPFSITEVERLRNILLRKPLYTPSFFSFLPCLIARIPVSYTHLRAHETRHDLVCRLLLEKKKKK